MKINLHQYSHFAHNFPTSPRSVALITEDYKLVYYDSEEEAIELQEDQDYNEARLYKEKRGLKHLEVNYVQRNASHKFVECTVNDYLKEQWQLRQQNAQAKNGIDFNVSGLSQNQGAKIDQNADIEEGFQMQEPSMRQRDTLAHFESDLRQLMRDQITKSVMDTILQDTVQMNQSQIQTTADHHHQIHNVNSNAQNHSGDSNMTIGTILDSLKIQNSIEIYHKQPTSQLQPQIIDPSLKLKFKDKMFTATPQQPLMIQCYNYQSIQGITLKWLISNQSSHVWPAIPNLQSIQDQSRLTYFNIFDRPLQPGEEVELSYRVGATDIEDCKGQFFNLQLYFVHPVKEDKHISQPLMVIIDKGIAQ
eukprot:403346036